MKISIVTISYNNINGLQKTVESVLSQSFFSHIEYIIIDGDSNDGTREYLKSLPPSVLSISEPDRGISDAFNKGVKLSTGDYVLCLNSGDTFNNQNIIETIYEDILKFHPDVISYKVKVSENLYIPSSTSEKEIKESCTMPHQGSFVSKSLYNSIGGYSEEYKIRMDFHFFARCRKRGFSFKYIDSVICNYEPGGTSMAKANRYRFFKEGLSIKLLYNIKTTLKDLIKFVLYKNK